jgi:hypothetical protein
LISSSMSRGRMRSRLFGAVMIGYKWDCGRRQKETVSGGENGCFGDPEIYPKGRLDAMECNDLKRLLSKDFGRITEPLLSPVPKGVRPRWGQSKVGSE